MSPMRICLVKMSSMGDVIHALPVVTDILRARPDAQVHWVVEESFADLPALHPGVAGLTVVALRRWRRQWRDRAVREQLRATRRALRAQSFDRIIDLQGLLKSAWVGRWPCGRRVGFDWHCAREPLASLTYHERHGVDMSAHAIERLRELAGKALDHPVSGLPVFGLAAPPPGPSLAQCLADLAQADGIEVFLHATSRAEKQWPAERWVELIRRRADQGAAVLLPWGSEAERQAADTLVASAGTGLVLPRLSLAECASLLAQARAVVGVDTGLTHLAAALDRPTVALFAATPAWRFGPYWTPRALSLGSDGQWPDVEAVEQALADARQAPAAESSAARPEAAR